MIEPYFFLLGQKKTAQILYRRRKFEELAILDKYVDRKQLIAEIQHIEAHTEMLSDIEIRSSLEQALSKFAKHGYVGETFSRICTHELEILFAPELIVEDIHHFEVVSSRTIQETDGARLIEVEIVAK